MNELWDWEIQNQNVRIYEINKKGDNSIYFLPDTAFNRDLAINWIKDHNKFVRLCEYFRLIGE